jgi:DNA-binding response OmpR family regulator
MKILAIDDQQLVLLPLEKRLNELGYQVKTATSGKEGIEMYHSFEPNLIIVDINMPEFSGLDLVKHIRIKENSKTPIMVLSGNTNDGIITESFDLGINDYMKKPLSLNEICARVKRLIGVPEGVVATTTTANTLIQQRCVGVVIPCYNEEERLLSTEFLNFVDAHAGYHLCFKKRKRKFYISI